LARRLPPPEDLGPVPFSITTEYAPRDERLPHPVDLVGGPLAELQAIHATIYRGKWAAHFGGVPLKLKTHVDVEAVEELFVFLLELVDGGFGEWTLRDKDQTIVLEAQVFGPDADLEFGDAEGNAPRFRRVRFPKRAKVRLRALVEESARLIRRMIVDVSVADPDFGGADEISADLDALVEAVAPLPRDFGNKDES